ncbi:MAG TPA: serpin family protein [Candidatus Sulfotelmatobacter sp.]|nr:serpin family protein [Candidatus Sulfotelmatobacter sp.]
MPWPFSRKSDTVLNGETVESRASPHTRFAFRLFRELSRANDSGNVFFSPSSVMLCLALVQELASGETRQSMAKVLEIGDLDQGGVEREIATLKSAFKARSDAETSFSNALFFAKHARVASALQTQLRTLYDAELSELDFSRLEAVATINAWVKGRTKGKIAQIVSQVSPQAALLALNAVYFKSRWLTPFMKELTQHRPFRVSAGPVKQLPMMLRGGTHKYYEERQIQVAVLPYRGHISLYILLPAVDVDINRFRQSFASGLWESWIAKLRSEPGTIQLPRFRVDYDVELNSALKALGMERAFDPHRAEFEQVQTDYPPVWLDRVVHRAVAEVNEEGTEAAAATMTHAASMSMTLRKPRKEFEMIVDHPFFALICDESTKTILFMGWIGDPQ